MRSKFKVGDLVTAKPNQAKVDAGHELTPNKIYKIYKVIELSDSTKYIYLSNYDRIHQGFERYNYSFHATRFNLIDPDTVPELVKVIYGVDDK